jgi:hypothetical protein
LADLEMDSALQDALLRQQLEFTQSELEDHKKKEENLKKTNESLLKALNSSAQNSENVREK